MTYNTGNQVPSTDPRDLYDNAENLDKLVNGENPFYADRLGKLRESWSGMESSFTNAQEGRENTFMLSQSDKESRFQAFLVSSGYVSKGDYAANVVLEERNEYVAVDAATTGTSAGMYRPNASAALPLTLTGTWATDSLNLVLLGDDVLRQELADPALGGDLVKVATSSGEQKLVDALDNRVIYVDTIAGLRSLEPAFDGQQVVLSDGGRSGLFKFMSSDFSDLVTLDPLSGVSVAPNSDASGTSGVWLRQFGQSVRYDGRISVKWFGAVGDFNINTGTGTDSTAAIQAAAEFVKQSGSIQYPGKPGDHPFHWKQCVLDFEAGFYLVTSPIWFGVDTLTETDYGKVVKDFRGDNAVVIGKTAGKPIVDMTGAFGVRGEGVTFMGWNVDSPNVGFLMARSGNSVPHNPSAGNHYFRDVNFAGWFTVGPVYNYGSEINHWVHCDFAAETGKCAFYHTADNFRLKLTSDHTTVDTTVQSCYGDLLENCTLNVKTTTSGDEGLFIVESTSYGPSVVNSYLDSDNAPYFLIRRSSQLPGTSGIVQTLRIRDNTFEAANQSIVKLVDSATLTALTVSGNAMPTLGGAVPHIHVTSGCILSDIDVQPFCGDTTNLPTRIQNDGNIARQHTTFFPLVDAYLSNWYRTEGQLTKDSTWRELDLSSDLAVPVTAKWVDVRVNVRTGTSVSDGTWLSLRGNAATPTAQQFTAMNEVVGVPQYFEGKVPVVDGKIEYYCHPNLSHARIMVRGYQI